MQDEIFIKTGVENEVFEDALAYYMQKEPDVKEAMDQYAAKM